MKKLVSLLLVLVMAAAMVLSASADVSPTWYCPKCGRANNANFCPQDGTAKPTDLYGGYNGNSSGNNSSGSYNYGQNTISVRPGDILRFGTYEQDNSYWDGAETIEWTVLEVSGSNALVISRQGLEARQPYHSAYMSINWEDCALRTWLNGAFLQQNFSQTERSAILTTTVDNSASQGNPGWTTPGCATTYDKVFLLSFAEVVKYMPSDSARQCMPTLYAQGQGAWSRDPNKPYAPAVCVWWLRTPGPAQYYAGAVDLQGHAGFYNSVGNNYACVRPVMWVDLSKLG